MEMLLLMVVVGVGFVAAEPEITLSPECETFKMLLDAKRSSCCSCDCKVSEKVEKISATSRYPSNLLNLVRLGERRYVLVKQAASWFDAMHFCQAHGLDLASIETSRENDLVMAHLSAVGVSDSHWVWVSANKLGRSTWLWLSGADLSFSSWQPGQPQSPEHELCMVLWKGKWWDLGCHIGHTVASGHRPTAFLCEETP